MSGLLASTRCVKRSFGSHCVLKKQSCSWEMVVSLNRGPQYRPQYSIIPIIGTPKKVPQISGNPQMFRQSGRCTSASERPRAGVSRRAADLRPLERPKRYPSNMGNCQNYGPFLGPYYTTGPNLGDPKRDHNFDNPPYLEFGNLSPKGLVQLKLFSRTASEQLLTVPSTERQ